MSGSTPTDEQLRLARNPLASRGGWPGVDEREGYDPAVAATARADLRRWPDYAATPLLDLPGLARQIGVATVHAKYEGSRTELASFKALGGAYALSVVLARELVRRGVPAPLTFADLDRGRHAAAAAGVTAVCASDGNHGRSLAWGARRFGCRCIVYLPRAVSEFRADAIARYGATVIRVDGNYDDAVRHAAADAAANGWLVVSDTASPGYREIPRLVMAGYSLMMEEAIAALDGVPPTHVFVQVGCGGLAAVVAGFLADRFGAVRPTIVAVEPVNAACLYESLASGSPAVVDGEHRTVMGGLACGELSYVAWPILRDRVDHAMTLPDDFALAAVRQLHAGVLGAHADAGESGAAGVGALLALADRREARLALGLGSDSRVLLFITEGVTDPEQFAAIIAPADAPSAASR